MEYNIFIEDHWQIFLNHLCHFHPLSQDFISKFGNDLNWRQMRYNKSLEWNVDLIQACPPYFPGIRNQKDPGKIRLHTNRENLLTKDELKDLPTTLSQTRTAYTLYTNLYHEYILPLIDKVGLRNIFEQKLNYNQKFYKLRPVDNDQNGHTTQFELPHNTAYRTDRDSTVHDIPYDLTVREKIGSGEGPPRLYEILNHHYIYTSALIVSENIKEILELFIIDEHSFRPLISKFTNLSTNLNFFLFSVVQNSLIGNEDLSHLYFFYTQKIDPTSGSRKKTLPKGAIKEFKDISLYKRENEIPGKSLTPTQYAFNNSKDVFSIDQDIIISERVKKCIEELLPDQVKFESAQLLNIRLNAEKTEVSPTSENITIKKQKTIIAEEISYYFNKASRLNNEQPELKVELPEDEFKLIQQKLKVIIPESVKEKYRLILIKMDEYMTIDEQERDKIEDEEGPIFSGLELEKIDRFHLQYEYANTLPETFKSLIIGNFGNGDELGLLLEKEDDFKLQEDFYFFSHEDGDVYITDIV